MSPGRTCRFSDIVASTRRRHSMMSPSPSVSMMLEYLPMSSTIRCFSHGSPSWSVVSKVMSAMRSIERWDIPVIRAPVRCFLSSMQNIGGCCGFSYEESVKCILASPVPAHIRSLPDAPCLRTDSTTVSRSGCCILSTRIPAASAPISRTSAEMHTESRGIAVHPVHSRREKDSNTVSSPAEVQPSEKRLQSCRSMVFTYGRSVRD